MTNLTPTQRTALETAATRPQGNIFPVISASGKELNGGAAGKVISALANKGLAHDASLNPPYCNWQISNAGYEAIGQEPPKKEEPTPVEEEPETTNEILDNFLDGLSIKIRRGSKKEMVIAMMLTEGGASNLEIAEATGWAAHTIRGFIAGTLKKQLGLVIDTERDFVHTETRRKYFTNYRIVGRKMAGQEEN